MRKYSVHNSLSGSEDWRDLHAQVFDAFENNSSILVHGNHESLPIEYELYVGRLVVKKVFDQQLPRTGIEFSGKAIGSYLLKPSFYVCRYGEGDPALNLQIHDDVPVPR